MSIYDKASLVLIPSGTKTSKVYSQKPVNGDGDFTFSRSTAATRVNADGNIEKETQNLLTYSNDFSQWTFGGVTRTGGQSGYDGSNNAWLITATNVSGVNVNQIVNTSGVKTYSIYAKAGTTNWIRMSFNDTAVNTRAWFDLTNGVVGTIIGYVIDTEITSLGSGWYRCSISVNLSVNSPSLYLFVVDGNGLTSASVGDSVYIQDVQLEQGLVARDYIETTTAAVEGGITDNVPRLDYTDSSCPALLLEPQRTNIFEQSEYFSGTYWAKTANGSGIAPVVTQNYAVSPEGLQNASRVQFDTNGSTSSDRSGLVRDFAFTTGDKYAISCWVKATSGNSEIFTFRIAGAQVGGEKTATNEWQLFTETHTATATTTDNFGIQIRGNYSSQTSDILIYGMQLESAVSYATSYIPTYGTSVTRAQDLASFSHDVATTSWSIFMDVKNWTDVLNAGQFSLGNIADTSNSLFYYSNCFGIQKEVGQSYFCSRLAVLGQSFNGKFAVIFDGVNTIKIYINGTLDTTSTLADTAKTSGIDSANLYYSGSAASKEIKSLLVFPTALTDQEAIDLTTI
jgi:hypothetical protein